MGFDGPRHMPLAQLEGDMESTTRRNVLSRLALSGLFLIVVVHVVFALAMGFSELLYVLGASPELKHRAAPVAFVIHGLAGAIVLFIGPLQSIRWVRARRQLRAALGRTYVVAVWFASVTAVVNTMWFGVSAAAKVMFLLVATLWFTTTTFGMLKARARRFAEQHEWMVRSYALSLFFVTFTLWVPALASTPLPAPVAYPLAVFLGGALNLVAAEIWIHRTRTRVRPAPIARTRMHLGEAVANQRW